MDDECFEALANETRRVLLVQLLEADRLGLSPDGGETALEGDHQPIALYHQHLPKLAEYGFIDWDGESLEITPGPRFEDIEPLLELVANRTERIDR